MEVGSNLPPLKNDIILEKKKELQEYQILKQIKLKMREEKRQQKFLEKNSKKKSRNDSNYNGSPEKLDGDMKNNESHPIILSENEASKVPYPDQEMTSNIPELFPTEPEP